MKIINYILLIVVFCLTSCSSCSKSGQKQLIKETKNKDDDKNNNHQTKRRDRNKNDAPKGITVVKMEKKDGVYQIPIEVNTIKMYFIFDTGASIISISQAEAIVLYKQGQLTEDDIIKKANFMNANGEISEGTIINLKTIKIGDKVLKNVEASVVHNLKAPLLFGQSALEKFGKISIDNKKQEITFEN